MLPWQLCNTILPMFQIHIKYWLRFFPIGIISQTWQKLFKMLNSTCLGWSLTLHYLLFLSELTIFSWFWFFCAYFLLSFWCWFTSYILQRYYTCQTYKEAHLQVQVLVPCHGFIIPQFWVVVNHFLLFLSYFFYQYFWHFISYNIKYAVSVIQAELLFI